MSGSDQLVQVDYTYWTLAYLLTKEGARRLVQGNPLDKMVPVDEYLPIMYDREATNSFIYNRGFYNSFFVDFKVEIVF